MDRSEGPILLYDGSCAFCSASIQFVLRHERQNTLRFAALDSPVGRAVRRAHPKLSGIDSMVWYEAGGHGPDRLLTRSDAGLQVARYLGGLWRLAVAARILPRALRDGVYDWIARHRHRLPGGQECVLPPESARARFLG